MNKTEIVSELFERFDGDDTWVDFIKRNRNKSAEIVWGNLLEQIEIVDNGKIDSLDYIFDNYEELHSEYRNR